MRSDDDSGSNKPPKTPPKDAPPREGPVEPVEDSADDPVPEHPGGTETDAELDDAVKAEPPPELDLSPEKKRYRKGRLSNPEIEPRLRRRYKRAVKDEDALNDLVQDTFLRAHTSREFPSEHETIFPFIYTPGAAARRKQIRALQRAREREMSLDVVDQYRHVDAPDIDPVPDDLERHQELLREVTANDTGKRKTVEAYARMAVGEESTAAVARDNNLSEDALLQRTSRLNRWFREALVQRAGVAMLLLVGGVLFYYARRDAVDPVVHVVPDPDPSSPRTNMRAVAAAEKADGLKACAAQDWDRCRLKLAMAQADDPTLENDPEVWRAAAEARDRHVFVPPVYVDGGGFEPKGPNKAPGDKGPAH